MNLNLSWSAIEIYVVETRGLMDDGAERGSGFNSIQYAVKGAKSRRKAEEMKEIKGGALSLIGMGSSIDSYFFLPAD